MKTFFIIVISTLLLCIQGIGQEYLYRYGSYEEGSTTYIYGDKVNVREEPNTNCKVIYQLKIGNEVKIISKCEETLTLNSYEESWYEIEYQGKTGFVWGGLLAKAYIEQDILPKHQGKEFVVIGIKKMDDYQKIVDARFCKSDGQILSNVEFKAIEMTMGENVQLFSYSTTGSYVGKKSFYPEIEFFKITFSYEACDFPNGDVYLFVQSEKINYAFSAIGMSNEFGSVSPDLIFPADENGERNVVIMVKNYVERDEETYQTKKTWTSTSRFIWTGEKFYQTEEKKD